MAKRLIHKELLPNGEIAFKVYYDKEWEEYQLISPLWKGMCPCSDKQDAIGTGRFELDRQIKNGHIAV